jgi:hypothetical protein
VEFIKPYRSIAAVIIFCILLVLLAIFVYRKIFKKVQDNKMLSSITLISLFVTIFLLVNYAFTLIKEINIIAVEMNTTNLPIFLEGKAVEKIYVDSFHKEENSVIYKKNLSRQEVYYDIYFIKLKDDRNKHKEITTSYIETTNEKEAYVETVWVEGLSKYEILKDRKIQNIEDGFYNTILYLPNNQED